MVLSMTSSGPNSCRKVRSMSLSEFLIGPGPLGANLDPCYWLRNKLTQSERPFYLWDIEKRQTVETHLLNNPGYTCVTHTSGPGVTEWLALDLSLAIDHPFMVTTPRFARPHPIVRLGSVCHTHLPNDSGVTHPYYCSCLWILQARLLVCSRSQT